MDENFISSKQLSVFDRFHQKIIIHIFIDIKQCLNSNGLLLNN
jgi:hypothetical protein